MATTVTGLVMTSSLNATITDSAPGMQNYVTGQKAASGQEGVWPDDTTDPFDNPRFEYLSEFLARTQGKKLGLVTTAAPYQADKGEQGPGAPYNASAKFFSVYSGDTARDHDVRISHISYDRQHTSAQDQNTWFPLPALRRAAENGRIGRVAPRFHGAPTNRSHRTTLDVDCVELLKRCREDHTDAVLLVAN